MTAELLASLPPAVRGALERGDAAGVLHAVAVDGATLPSGTYVARVAGETFDASQVLTLLK